MAPPLDGIGYLTPTGEQRAVSGALFSSSMFKGRAPVGYVTLTAYLGGARAPLLALLEPDELVRIVETEFADLLGTKGRPILTRVRVWPRGLPQHNVGHRAPAIALQSTRDRIRGLFVTGNYLNGVSVAACLSQATETANQVDEFLSATNEPAAAMAYRSNAA